MWQVAKYENWGEVSSETSCINTDFSYEISIDKNKVNLYKKSIL